VGLAFGAQRSFKVLKADKQPASGGGSAAVGSGAPAGSRNSSSLYNTEEGERVLKYWSVLSLLWLWEAYLEWLAFLVPFYTEAKFALLL
jgi:hypothetical protein